MKRKQALVSIVALGVGICAFFMLAGPALGQPCDQWVAKIVSVQGAVQVRKTGEISWIQVRLNQTYCPGDIIRVLKNSRAAISLSNDSLIRVDQNTTITFTGIEKEKTFFIDLIRGVAHFFSRFPRRLKVATPFVNAAVEGTEFYMRVEDDQTVISIFEGRVAATNAAGSLMLAGGQSAVAEAGKAPVSRVVVRPRDAVQWALYYLPVMYFPPGEAPKENIRDPRFLAYRASQLLVVGRVDEARADIGRALSIDPKYGDAFALQSIIAVVQSEKDKALSTAQKAIEAGPNSAAARIAMSYARQASFDLESARDSVEEAVKLDPNNALAWARLAELWSSLGYIDKGLDAAQKAVTLDPSHARTQMVLGFAYLTQVKTTEAEAAFEKAIELDQADPLSRLGLGLAKIRAGHLKSGGREIEIAASLDPNNSIVRSYLGKVYFEEKRTGLDAREYEIAKQLDPNDPTPWFYDAIAKQTTNRPVEALRDMQKSIELNDNRVVYRSRLLLDEDLAARSASLGRIYNDIGFQQLGLVEGWKSVNTAPANFSAHRLLADLYAALPRHEIARVSELLQSQLLQPLNITPVQTRLAESDLLMLEGAGPADLAFNEFNPLFLRNRLALQASGVAGENDTLGGEVVQSGVWGYASYSIGGLHYETDGFRENNDLDRKLYNVFAQINPWYKTSILAEYRYTDTHSGDLPLRFDPDNFSSNRRKKEETESIRLGLRHSFTPGSDLITTFAYVDLEDRASDSNPFSSVDIKVEDDGYIAEAQHLLSLNRFQLTSGAGYFDADRELTSSLTATLPFPPFFLDDTDVTKPNIQHLNLYVYSQLNYPENVTWTLGGSVDFLDGAIVDRDRFNPKFGLIWNPFAKTTFRAAAFRTLQRSLISSQTIEPTQVAGFNQFFEDTEGTEAWRYGIAVDQKFSPNIYGGAEYSQRDLDVPFKDLTVGGKIREVDWDEKLGRAYLFWTPLDWLTLSSEYQYENFDRDRENTGEEQIRGLKTHRLPLGINFFHPIGLFAGLKATYIDQEGDFGNDSEGFAHESDQFWIFDASIGYRLPKRYGLITIEARNLFDEEFNFQDTDPANPDINPERYISARLTLAF